MPYWSIPSYHAPMDQRQPVIIQAVLDAGFDRAAALPIQDAGDERYHEWIAKAYHGSMDWMARHVPAKSNPASEFPEYKSLIVCALEYGESEAPDPNPNIGNISRYALGDDYHKLMKARLHAAADQLRSQFPDLATRAFVDTGPINEKLVAARAGLGWQGKHTNLIHEEHGSYFFLGLLLVSAELDTKLPKAVDRCGVCDACIPACPTGAIIEPYVLDAQRCISYLTIELRGSIPREFRSLIGNRIFGCDDCQEACPWNRFAKKAPPPELAPRDMSRTTEVATWLSMPHKEWTRRFKNSAVKRTKYAGFLRNALVAAGNTQNPELIPHVVAKLHDPDPILREHAAWALGRIGTSAAKSALAARQSEETESAVSQELALALAELEAV